MSLLDGFKANKAIAVLLAEEPGAAGEAREAASKLKQMGGRAVPRLIDALEEDPANRNILSILAGLLDNESLHYYTDGLAHQDKRVVSSVMQILARSALYDANRLFELFEDPDIPKNVLLQILVSRKENINLRTLLDLLKDSNKTTRQLVFRVLEFAAREDALPHLLPYLESNDPDTRVQVTRVIARFDNALARDALLRTISDPHKTVRLAAIDGISKLTVTVPSQPICQLLKDSDITIQGKAVEALVKIHDPQTVKYLIDVLQDDSEYVRRAAVEVLNEIGDHRAIRDLLNALRDKDWWIRVRAADALGSIGGPKVIDAVLELMRDDDEFLRRTAVEILNNIKDERAVSHLVEALEDSDWWVRERAADALAELGDAKAAPALVNMMIKHGESEQVALRALARISDHDTVEGILTHAEGIEETRRTELLATVAATDMTPPPTMESAPTRVIGSPSGSLAQRVPGGDKEKAIDSKDETMISVDRRAAGGAAGSSEPSLQSPAPGTPDVSV
ncbi:MAG: HEAT repeat domain-containing protein, partial [Pseudomonadota bacterium]